MGGVYKWSFHMMLYIFVMFCKKILLLEGEGVFDVKGSDFSCKNSSSTLLLQRTGLIF